MNKFCIICDGDGKYKCPTCLIYYCSAVCCKKHRTQNCTVITENTATKENQDVEMDEPKSSTTYHTSIVPMDKLNLLKNDEDLKKLLHNKHLRDLLLVIDKADNAEEIMQKAMQEPLFVEFADACLKVVNPETEEDS